MLELLFKEYRDNVGKNSSLDRDELVTLARAIFNDLELNQILIKRGPHESLHQEEDDAISRFLIAYAQDRGWESLDPRNFCISLALARLFATEEISHRDKKRAGKFVEDKSLSGIVKNKPSTHKPIRISELIPILDQLDRNIELKEPYRKYRSSTNQSVFANEDIRLAHEARVLHFLSDQWDKYALWSRGTQAMHRVLHLMHLYAEKKVDSIRGLDAIAYFKRFSKPNPVLKVIDDLNPGAGNG